MSKKKKVKEPDKKPGRILIIGIVILFAVVLFSGLAPEQAADNMFVQAGFGIGGILIGSGGMAMYRAKQ